MATFGLNFLAVAVAAVAYVVADAPESAYGERAATRQLPIEHVLLKDLEVCWA